MEKWQEVKIRRANDCLAQAAKRLEEARSQIVFARQIAEEIATETHATACLDAFYERLDISVEEIGRPIAAGAFTEKLSK